MLHAIIDFIVGFLTAGPDGVSLGILGLLAPLALPTLGGVSGYVQGKEQEKLSSGAFNAMLGETKRREAKALGMTDENNLYNLFGAMQQAAAPNLNALSRFNALGAMQAAQSGQANLARLGLGGTGLGSALGSGLQAGAALQTNALRARMLQDLQREAANAQLTRAGFVLGQPLPQYQVPQQGPEGGATQGFGAGLQAYGGLLTGGGSGLPFL